MDEWQSTGEIEAAFADDGPIMAARRWLVTVLSVADLDAAWPLVDPLFRLVLTQTWLWGYRDELELAPYELEETAEALAVEYPVHDLWAAFSTTLLDELEARWPWVDFESLGAASRPRIVAIGFELVVFAPAGPGNTVLRTDEPEVLDPALQLLMHHEDGRWLVGGFGSDELPEPGWPALP